MTEFQFERACDINYALEHYEDALTLLKDKAHYSLMVVLESENKYTQGQNIATPRKIVDNSTTDFIREIIEEHEVKLIEEIQARIDKLHKEIEEL